MSYQKKSGNTQKAIYKYSKYISLGFMALLVVVIPTFIASQKQDIRQRAVGPSSSHPTGTYTDWNWPSSSAGFNSFEWQVTVLTDPTPAGYFWSHQYRFNNGEGGYSGLQSQGTRRADGSRGKLAIFSLWNTTVSQGPACGKFGGEGVGQSCSVAYEWVANHAYKLRISKISADSGGTWWGSWVKDTGTNSETFIGQIKVPQSWGGLGKSSVMWTENFSAFTSCNNLIHSSVIFGIPVANGAISPSSRNNHLGNPIGCSGSSITDVPNGVQQDMGANSTSQPTFPSGSTPIPTKSSQPTTAPAGPNYNRNNMLQRMNSLFKR